MIFLRTKRNFEVKIKNIFLSFKSALFQIIQSNLYKMTTLGTTQERSSWASGHLTKHLYKTTTNQMWSFLAGVLFFSHGNICLNKHLQLCMFWCHSQELKMFQVTFHFDLTYIKMLLRWPLGCYCNSDTKTKIVTFLSK